MMMQSNARRLLGTTSVLALSAAAMIGTAQPSAAQTNTIATGIFAGGSTLASLTFRQIFDCYMGQTVGTNNAPTSPPWDGYTFTTATTLTPGKLPGNTVAANGRLGCLNTTHAVEGMYAGVGSGNGFRGYIANSPSQWYGGTVTPTTTAAVIASPFPAALPPYKDSNNTNTTTFGAYPYPQVDIALSDSPLASTVAALTTVSEPFTPTNNWGAQVTVGTSGAAVTKTYSTSSFGQPIQVPAFEVGVAVAVNVATTTAATWSINSQIKSGGNIIQGGAIQLTEGQLCAIFSGKTTNWNSTATIPFFNSTTSTSAAFSYANVGNGVGTPQPYASASLPITVVFRSDGSGTSFILTQYLKNVCPLLDPAGTGSYAAIFNQTNLPSTSFQNLINNIVAVRGNGPWNAPTTTTHWIGASGSGGVATAIGTGSASSGFIGYVSSDFTSPYAITVTDGTTTVSAPLEASLQNEALRLAGTSVPNTVSTAALTFIPPTPGSVDAAWQDATLLAQVPNSTSTYNDWNVYAKNYTANTTRGGITFTTSNSILATTNASGAYPLTGTTFLALYNCYDTAARATNLRNFLDWFYTTSTDGGVNQVINNNGFSQLTSTWQTPLKQRYITTASTRISSAGAALSACSGVTGGAH